MKTAMRLAFENAKVSPYTSFALVTKLLKSMERQDESAKRKLLRRASAVSKVRGE